MLLILFIYGDVMSLVKLLMFCGILVSGIGILPLVSMGDQPAEVGAFGRYPATECPICQEGFAGSGAIIELACGHALHQRCYGRWVQSKQCRESDIICPTCRAVDLFAHAAENILVGEENWQRYFNNCIALDPTILGRSDGYGNTLLQYALSCAIGREELNDIDTADLIATILDLIRDPRTRVVSGERLAPLRVLHPIREQMLLFTQALMQEGDFAVAGDAEQPDEIGEDGQVGEHALLSSPMILAERLGNHVVIEMLHDRYVVDRIIPVDIPPFNLDLCAINIDSSSDGFKTPPPSPPRKRKADRGLARFAAKRQRRDEI